MGSSPWVVLLVMVSPIRMDNSSEGSKLPSLLTSLLKTGNYSLQSQLKIKLPCVMQLYSEIIASTSGVEAAKELRLRCAIWRESMRKFWPAFGSSQLMADFSKSLDEWSKSLDPTLTAAS